MKFIREIGRKDALQVHVTSTTFDFIKLLYIIQLVIIKLRFHLYVFHPYSVRIPYVINRNRFYNKTKGLSPCAFP